MYNFLVLDKMLDEETGEFGGNFAYNAADYFCKLICQIAAQKERVAIAISGGNTPKEMLQIMADKSQKFYGKIPWDKIDLFFVDERNVPPEHDESNYKMVKLALLDKVPMQAEQIFRIKAELSAELAAAEYSRDILAYFGGNPQEIPKFDIIQLGMGDDGHTASLFPNTAALSEETAVAVANFVPKLDTWRITLTKTVINNAENVFFLIAGENKSATLQKVTQGEFLSEIFPMQLIKPKNGEIDLLVEWAAVRWLMVDN